MNHFMNKWIQYNITPALAIAGTIREKTSREKLYEEMGLKSLRKRRWYKTLLLFQNI